MTYDVEGVIYKVGDVLTLGEKGFQKQEILVECEKREWDGKDYSEIVKFVVGKKDFDAVATYSVGDPVKIGFALSGRLWNSPDKGEISFTELKMTWIQRMGMTAKPIAQAVADINQVSEEQVIDDGLPF